MLLDTESASWGGCGTVPGDVSVDVVFGALGDSVRLVVPLSGMNHVVEEDVVFD